MLTLVVIVLLVVLMVIALAGVLREPARGEAPLEPLAGVTPTAEIGPRGAPLPVVLVHGLFGFDRIAIPGARFDYFHGVADHLTTLGCHAHAVRLPPARSIPVRAKALVEAIEALGDSHARVDLIAHSLGGLDARYALAHLGLAERVRSLVTIGTPHRGSQIADLVTTGAIGWAHRAIRAIGVPIEAVEQLTTTALERFNREVPDVPGVRYACVVGGVHRADTRISLPLVPAHAFLKSFGVNDGLVTVTSQYWGETLAEIEADHLAQIGWRVALRNSFDALGLYAFVVARLGDDRPRLRASA